MMMNKKENIILKREGGEDKKEKCNTELCRCI